MRRLVEVALLAAASAAGQTFEVASLKVAPERVGEARYMKFDEGQGRLAYSNVSLKILVSMAFEADSDHVQGREEWYDSGRYDLAATFPAGSTKPQIHAMLRALLAERMELVTHKTTKEVSALELYPDAKGVKLKPAAEGAKGMPITYRGGLRGVSMTTDHLANMIGRQVGQPVLDKTEQTGTFDIELRWTPDIAEEAGASIYTALREQLGLRLRPSQTKTTVETLVIDSARREPLEP